MLIYHITIPDKYLIPKLQSFHQKLEKAAIIWKIELVYHFIPVAPEAVEKTEIYTSFGLIE